MKTKIFCSFCILVIAVGGFSIFGETSLAQTANYLVISEVQVAGATADDEFVEIYNPTEVSINLETLPLKLHIRTSTGTDQNRALTFINKIIPARGYFLIGPASGYVGITPLDATYSTSGNKLVANGSVYISKSSMAETDVIDKVGWGSQPSPGYENTPAPSPSANQSLERKPGGVQGNGEDSNINSNDFFLQTSPNPQNSQSEPQPPLPSPPQGPICGNGTCEAGEDTNNCSTDCSPLPPSGPICGNSICESGENSLTCPADCSSPPSPPPLPPNEPIVGDVIINEFVSDPAEGGEWIEIYNKKDFNIDLTGWKLEDGVGAIATLSGTITGSGAEKFKVIELTSSKLNNDGDIIKLKKSDGTIIDQVTYGNWNDGNINDNAPKAIDPWSTARATDGVDTDNDANDFRVTTTLTKGSSNIITAPPSSDGASVPPPSTPSSPASWPASALLINEFVADPSDGNNEWIELYNTTSANINLTGWTIEDGSETITKLSGNVPPLGFFVLEKPKGILNNAGDLIILKDPAGTIIDKVTYGNWNDGEISDNAPTALDPNSVARKIDGQDTNNDFNDFAITTPTKGGPNVFQKKTTSASLKDIIINEILPNPKGDDSQNEFIELKNIGTAEINLDGWKLGDGSTKIYTIKSADFATTKIKPGEFFVLYRKITGIALNNTGTEAVKLYSPDGALLTSIEYTGPALEEQSFAREKENWFWTTTVTPGKENIITIKNKLPVAVIVAPEQGEVGENILFDGSDSNDPDGNIINFLWNFGDKKTAEGTSVSHIFQNKGKFKITLTVKDNNGETNTATTFITISDPDAQESFASFGAPLLVINEILPNPEGSDEGEWIELYNLSNQEIDLSGWKLDDDEGGSRPYKIPEGTIIGPGKFLVFKKEASRLALNNTYDAVRLLDPAGDIIFEISYDEVIEGASYARDEGGAWKWTTALTPGAKNIFTFQEKNKKTTRAASRRAAAKNAASKQTTKFVETTLEEIKEQDLGDGVKVKGQVIVEPGILGSQIFYIANEEACPGVQIYMYKKDFPELKLGDLIEVFGVLSETGGERRIKVKEKNHIKILEKKEPPTPLPIQMNEVEESLEGCLVVATGEITEKSGSNIYFDDEQGELRIYFKSSLNFPKPQFKIGDTIETIGIISQTKTGYRLLPRYESDLKIKTLTAPPLEEKSIIEVPTGNRRNQILGFLTAAAGILGLTLVGLGIKTGTFSNWWKKIKGL